MSRMAKRKRVGRGRSGNKSSTPAGALYTSDSNLLFHDADAYDFPTSFQWINKTDTVYGIIGSDPFNPGGRKITEIYGEEVGALPRDIRLSYSLQWEYEFSPSKIILTFGGNDSNNISEQPLIRDVVTGSFTYKNGLVAGTISGVASARYQRKLQVIDSYSGQQDFVRVEEASIWKANSLVSFSGLRSLGQILGRRFQSTLNPLPSLAKVADYSSSIAGSDRSVLDLNGYGAVIAAGWQNSPFLPDLI